MNYMLIDFGSTYTKLCVIDVDQEKIIGTAKAMTTVTTNIMNGFYEAERQFIEHYGKVEIHKRIASSSAAGGLRMIAIGFVPELTLEAAKRAALGAGARILKTYSFELNRSDLKEILELNPDIVLLAGGTDGGNRACILHNAAALAKQKVTFPIVVAGNKSTQDEIEELFIEHGISYYLADNVMPVLNKLQVDSAREKIRQCFMEKIVYAKGFHDATTYVSDILYPTPQAVLKAAQMLAQGTPSEDGYGDLAIVDIGGATTDVHSICKGYPTMGGVSMKGLEEPFAKRSVEGDLGMRVSAVSLYHSCGATNISKYYHGERNAIEQKCQYRQLNPEFLPQDADETEFDNAIAKCAIETSLNRHAGYLETLYMPGSVVLFQHGKDLSELKYLIGTGGILVHHDEPFELLKAALVDQDPTILKPKHPTLLVDQEYILYAIGLLALEYPNQAIRILKKSLKGEIRSAK